MLTSCVKIFSFEWIIHVLTTIKIRFRYFLPITKIHWNKQNELYLPVRFHEFTIKEAVSNGSTWCYRPGVTGADVFCSVWFTVWVQCAGRHSIPMDLVVIARPHVASVVLVVVWQPIVHVDIFLQETTLQLCTYIPIKKMYTVNIKA